MQSVSDVGTAVSDGSLVALPHAGSEPPPLSSTLLERCRRGDHAALESVFRAETPALLRLITRFIGPHADADDILTDTLLAAAMGFPKYRGEAAVSTWLASIAIRMVRRYWRHPERQGRVSLDLVVEPADSGPAADHTVESRRLLERVYHHLATLDENKRVVLILHVFDGRPIEEVAALVGASRAATKSRVFWGRRKLLAKAKKDPVLKEFIAELEAV